MRAAARTASSSPAGRLNSRVAHETAEERATDANGDRQRDADRVRVWDSEPAQCSDDEARQSEVEDVDDHRGISHAVCWESAASRTALREAAENTDHRLSGRGPPHEIGRRTPRSGAQESAVHPRWRRTDRRVVGGLWRGTFGDAGRRSLGGPRPFRPQPVAGVRWETRTCSGGRSLPELDHVSVSVQDSELA